MAEVKVVTPEKMSVDDLDRALDALCYRAGSHGLTVAEVIGTMEYVKARILNNVMEDNDATS